MKSSGSLFCHPRWKINQSYIVFHGAPVSCGNHAIDHVVKSPCEATCSQVRGECVLHLDLPDSQPPIDTQAPTEGQQDNSSNTAAMCREQSSILITKNPHYFPSIQRVCRNVTYKYKDGSNDTDIAIEKSISSVFVSTIVDNTSTEREIFVLDCFHISAGKVFFFSFFF